MLTVAAVAGVNAWTQIGPDGGEIQGVAGAPSDPAVLYAAGATIFRSADEGVTWERTAAPRMERSCQLQRRCDRSPTPLLRRRRGGLAQRERSRHLDGEQQRAARSELTLLDRGRPQRLVLPGLHGSRADLHQSRSSGVVAGDPGASWRHGGIGSRRPWSCGRALDADLAGRGLPECRLRSQLGASPVGPSSWTSTLLAAVGPARLLPALPGERWRHLSQQRRWAHWMEIPARGSLVVGADSVLYGFETSAIYFVPPVFRSEDFGTTWQLLFVQPVSIHSHFGRFLDDLDPARPPRGGLLEPEAECRSRRIMAGRDLRNAGVDGELAWSIDRTPRRSMESAATRRAPSASSTRPTAVPPGRVFSSPRRRAGPTSRISRSTPSRSRHLFAVTTPTNSSCLSGILSSRDEGEYLDAPPGRFRLYPILEVAADPLTAESTLPDGLRTPNSAPHPASPGGATMPASHGSASRPTRPGVVDSVSSRRAPSSPALFSRWDRAGIYRSVELGNRLDPRHRAGEHSSRGTSPMSSRRRRHGLVRRAAYAGSSATVRLLHQSRSGA